MEINYKRLWILLIEKNISPAALRKDLNIATGTMTKMRKMKMWHCQCFYVYANI